jgi:DNA-binding MarR family transcriptional regulator
MLSANHLAVLGTMIDDRLTRAFAPLSPSAAAVLLTLHHRGPLTTAELGQIIAIAQPTVTRMVTGLAAQGFIRRQARAGRITPLTLTEQGTARAQGLQEARAAAITPLLDALPPDERASFDGMLARILAAATSSRRFARTTCRYCDHAICDGAACPIGCRARELEGSC